jgi:hypothetical protein
MYMRYCPLEQKWKWSIQLLGTQFSIAFYMYARSRKHTASYDVLRIKTRVLTLELEPAYFQVPC